MLPNMKLFAELNRIQSPRRLQNLVLIASRRQRRQQAREVSKTYKSAEAPTGT